MRCAGQEHAAVVDIPTNPCTVQAIKNLGQTHNYNYNIHTGLNKGIKIDRKTQTLFFLGRIDDGAIPGMIFSSPAVVGLGPIGGSSVRCYCRQGFLYLA